jgi:GH15 family glucan-1,4-alpha-glucosidase
VRIGNGAHDQLQLDIYGEVVDAAAEFATHGGRFDRDTTSLLTDLGQTVCSHWQEPDHGIWETRAGTFHHTHSKVLCWAALDRLIRMHEAGLLRTDVERFRRTAAAIRDEIENHGFNRELDSYTQVFDGREVDAALLALPHFGYIDASHPRMQSTMARIQKELGQDGLVYRYRPAHTDGLPPGEGAFGVCAFWAVECVARGGDRARAEGDFERLCARANDVGLFAEELDPESGAHLGNFPQGFTHIGLINAALTLLQPESKRETLDVKAEGGQR